MLIINKIVSTSLFVGRYLFCRLKGETMKNQKTNKPPISLLLLILSFACIYIGLKNFFTIPSSVSYEDKGIHTFLPYQVLPSQVKNTSGGRSSRLHPTKTVYFVYYKTNDGTNYVWKYQTAYKTSAENKVSECISVQRRVLKIKNTNEYITINPEQTAESYTNNKRKLYGFIIGFSISYIIIYIIVWIIIIYKKQLT